MSKDIRNPKIDNSPRSSGSSSRPQSRSRTRPMKYSIFPPVSLSLAHF